MSEPVSTAEIEDVLSSIRRLVSNDVETAQESVAPEPADAEPASKLILTADFRISEQQDVSPDEDASDATEQSGATVEDVAQTEVAEDAPFEFHHTDHTSETETDFEAQVDTAIDQEPADEDVSNEVWQDSAEPIEHAEDVVADTSPLEDTIAELEAAIGQQGGEWEPDGSGFEEDADAEEVMSEPVQDWIDGTAQEVVAETEAEATQADTETTADKGDADLFGVDESVIDEETLRDMVSDIVRQELQGALGERITRNVRKLVRREINRVLASQDFD